MVPRRLTVLSNWLARHFIAASLIVFVCAAVPRILFAWRADPGVVFRLYSDSDSYTSLAQRLLEQGAFVDRGGRPYTHRPPGYPAFLAVLFLAGRSLPSVLILQAALLSVGVLALYWLARRILPPSTAFVGAAVAAFSPWGIAFAAIPVSDGLFLALLALACLAVRGVEEAPSVRSAVLGSALTGLATGAAVLVRPVSVLIVLVGAMLFLHYGPRRKGSWLALGAMLACAAAPMFLWIERNDRAMHFRGLSTVPAVTAYEMLGARVEADASGRDRWEVHKDFSKEDKSWGLPVTETNDEMWRRAKAIFRDHPALTVHAFGLSAAEHAFHPSPDILSAVHLSFPGDGAVLALVWGATLILAALGAVTGRRADDPMGPTDRRWLLSLSLLGILLTLSSGLSFGNGARLRLPLELIVPLLAARGFVLILRAVSPDAPSSLPR